MTSSRIITVDISGTIARIVRAVIDLTDRDDIIHINVSTGAAALAELERGGAGMLVTTIDLSDDIKGFELALRVSQSSPETGVVILAEVEDMETLDEEMIANSPFLYMHRPLDPKQFLRVMLAGLDGEDMHAALAAPEGGGGGFPEFGPVPTIDLEIARGFIDTLRMDVPAQAIFLTTRTGEVALERGASGINRDDLSQALNAALLTTINLHKLVGGDTVSVQFYDGSDFDVFVLSIGLHYFLSLVFDGESGSRQFGVVNRFGRRTAQDLIAMLGPSAYMLQQPAVAQPAEEKKPRKKARVQEPEPEAEEEVAVRATKKKKTSELDRLQLEPIEELDASIFDDVEGMDLSEADDLFDLDALGEIAAETAPQARGSLSFEEAKELGIVSEE